MKSGNLRWLKWKMLIEDHFGNRERPSHENGIHIQEAMEWLARAQDATPDRGVCRLFSLTKGWAPSYPEVTGYIIPTFLQYAKISGNASYKQRALQMADWLIEIQMDCGPIQAGMINAFPKVPTVFNTGQVLFGLIEAFRDTENEKYLEAAVRAGDWLVSVLA